MQGTVEVPLTPAAFDAWSCIPCAQLLWHMPSVVCREQCGALSPTCGHTNWHTRSHSPCTRERGLGRLGDTLHFKTLREDQVHKPGAEV